jgi:hypothetical protein
MRNPSVQSVMYVGCAFVLVAVATTIASCSSSSAPPGDEGGVDAQTADVLDAYDEPFVCVVQTCSGSVTLKPNQTIPVGDTCGNTCSYKPGGGITACECTFVSGCDCLDAGDQ